jgi:hypothetical protein
MVTAEITSPQTHTLAGRFKAISAGSGAERKWRSMRNERDIREFKAFLRALIPMMVMGCGMYAWALILWMVAG